MKVHSACTVRLPPNSDVEDAEYEDGELEEEDDEDEPESGQVFLVVASSRPDLIDPALLRPGRIEKHIYIGLPSPVDREAILSLALKRSENSLVVREDLASTIVNISNSEKAQYFTPADLKGLISTASLNAAYEHIELRKKTPLQIMSTHLMSAYIQTKPSITEEDMLMYSRVYAMFQGKDCEPINNIVHQRVSLK
jgi:SpoVK/Ycf46/Vps4 family AAA+-type ATPase